MSVHVSSWAWKQKLGDPGLKLVLVKLADNADDNGYSYWRQQRLADECEMSRATVQRKLKALAGRGLIEVVERSNGQGFQVANGYRILRPGSVPQSDAPSVPHSADAPGASTVMQQEPSEEPKTSTPAELRVRIEQTWLSSEGMIAHRESYFADAKVRRAIDKAVKTYGADDVCAAITSYATVLASPQHRWSHRWTLLDFLTRGLDRFVPEAEPEVVFRDNGVAGGRPGNDNAEDDGLDYLNT